MLPSMAFTFKHVSGEIKLMEALHDDDFYSGYRIIDAAAEM